MQGDCFWCVHSPSPPPPPPPVFNTRPHHSRNAQKPKATHQAAPTPALRRAQSCSQGLTCPLAHSLGPASQTHKRTTELRTGDTTTYSVLSAQGPLLVATYTEPSTLPVHVVSLHWVLWIQEQILQELIVRLENLRSKQLKYNRIGAGTKMGFHSTPDLFLDSSSFFLPPTTSVINSST